MKMDSSFKHLPKVQKFAFLFMMLEVPILMALLFLILLLVVEVKEFTFLMLPLVFGLVSPAVILKDILNHSTVNVGERSVVLEKRFGKKIKIDLVDIKVVVGL
ncbi:MAG: hypothetical protein KAH57_10735, partial [Thermoplasmata archaeon]|nr:hypothetical protein [Thermoplasmata archaeon]